MNLTEMIARVRKDLHDEDADNYQWTDDKLTRHINRAVRELSEKVPLPAKATLPTTPSSRQIDLSSLNNKVMVQAVEYPMDETPPQYQRFSIWGDNLSMLSGNEPDGSNCCIYYGVIHTLDASGSTIPTQYEDVVATGACGYAAIEWAAFAINRVNVGGIMTPKEYRTWGNERLTVFRERLKRLGRKQRIRSQQLFTG
ncbi:hypothetical protein ACFLWY_02460 [Chloroflexota bacterium]